MTDKSITIDEWVKDEYDLVKVKLAWSLKMKLTDSECIHLLCESDLDADMMKIVRQKMEEREAKQKKKSYHKNDHVRKKSYHKND